MPRAGYAARAYGGAEAGLGGARPGDDAAALERSTTRRRVLHRSLRAGLIALAALAVGCLGQGGGAWPPAAYGQDVVELLPDQPVPAGYVSQSIFVICSPDWILREREEDLLALHAYFEAFGRAIGRDHAAVWFWQSLPDLEDGLADDLDVERSAEICSGLRLRPSESPHIVVTSRWDRDHMILALGGLEASRIRQVLVRLADRLVAGGIAAEDVESEIWWQTWYAAADQALRGLAQVASAVKLTIDTKFFKLELDGRELVD